MTGMRPGARLAATGLIVFIVTLVAGIPASVAVGWFAPDAAGFSGTAGTIWRGSAHSIAIGGARLGETSWKLSPIALLRGRLAAKVRTSLGDGVAEGNLAVAITGSIACSACRYQGRIRNLQTLLPALAALDGRADIQFESFEMRDAWPSRVVATVTVHDVALGPPGDSTIESALAAFEAKVDADPVADNAPIEATIADIGGPVEVDGRLVLQPPGSFTFSGRARSRPGAPPAVVSALGVLGPRGSDGSTELSFSGSL